jgi:NAD(P)-dependent dehydrogenase (short-subunit alcohol dehydrogenase family)
MRLDGKVCFVTGGASGMGRVAAAMFCAEGARVAVADVNAEACETAAVAARKEVAGHGDAFAVPCDVTRDADVQKAIAATVERYGELHVLYNNAGIMMAEDGSVVDTEEWVWDRTLAVNLKGIYLCCKHGIPEMIRSGGGSVINIASFVALVGCSVPQDAYTASKGAVIALTKSLAVQFGPKGVRANAICPGPIETPFIASVAREWGGGDIEKGRAEMSESVPMHRLGDPDEVAGLVCWLLSDQASYMTGAIIPIDGGRTAY